MSRVPLKKFYWPTSGNFALFLAPESTGKTAPFIFVLHNGRPAYYGRNEDGDHGQPDFYGI